MADEQDPPVDDGTPETTPESPPVEAEATETTEVRVEQRTNWPLRIVKWVVGLVVGLAALVALGVYLLDTGPGHRFVSDQIEKLQFENGLKIKVARIDGSIYGAMTLRGLSVGDQKGEFLFSPEIKVDWRPFSYLSNHVDLRALTAQRMVLRRAPELKPSTEEGPLLPDLDIDIGKLRVDRFVAEAPVSGERRIFLLDGRAHIAAGRAQVWFDGSAVGGQGRAGGDRVKLVLDAVPETNKLNFQLSLDAPQGGVLARLSGLTQPLSVRIDGKGDWKVWNGKFDADLGGAEFARLALTARDGTFAIKGPARFARLVNGATANLLGPANAIDLTAVVKARKADLSGTLSGDAMGLSVKGGVDLSNNSFADFQVGFALLRPSAIAPNLSGQDMRAQLTLNGAMARPTVAYVLNAARIQMNDMGLERLTATGESRVDADRIIIPVAARVGRITGLDTVAGGQLANVRLDGDLAIDWPRILSDNMRIRSDRIDAGLVLIADTSKGLYTGAINGKIDNYKVESVGTFNIETNVDLKTVPQGFAMVGKVRARSTKLSNEGVRNFLGGNLTASAGVAYGPDGIIRFNTLRLESPQLRVTGGDGSYSPSGQIVLNAQAVHRQYGKVGVKVAGTVSNPRASVVAERPGLGIGLANLEAQITGAPGGYRLKAEADTDYGPLTADVVLGLGKVTTVEIASANLGGIDFAGSLRQLPAGPFAGQLTARGNGLNGLVRLGAQGKYQEALINLRAEDTVLPGPASLAIGAAIVDARVVLYDKPWIVADAQIADTRINALSIREARAIIDYRDGRGQAKLVARGYTGVPFRIAANADLQPKLWKAMINGTVRGLAFKTTSPARVIPSAKGYELLPTRIDFGKGNIRLAGTYGPGLKVETRLDAFDMSLVNAFMPAIGVGGSATGSLDFEQATTDAFPRADARLSIDNFTRTTSVSISEPVDVNFVGKLLPDGGEASAVFRERGTVIGRMQASLRPLPPGAGAWTDRLFGAPLGGGIRYNGPADTLFSFAGLSNQRLSGPIGVAADFSGRLSAPALTGVIRANSLTYENQIYGTKLTNMALSGRFTGDRFEIEKLTANAGAGTLAASGFVSLAAEAGYPMDVSVTMNNAQLARSNAVSAAATGQLRLTKAAGETALLQGKIALPETRYEIIRQGASQVPELTGVRFKPNRRQRFTTEEPQKPAPGLFSNIRLDLALSAPERLYVSGMGLESEWGANFRVTGTSAVPNLTGEVELIRGTLGFANRNFDLTEGRVTFTGGRTIDPIVQMTASDDIEDVTVNVNVAGRAYNPQITFSSSPGLPQDEILSRILFGSSVTSISPIQAVQLAASLNSLRGSGGGLNPMGKLRSATGISRLRILSPDEASGRGTALAAGQYITDDIYVELVTDARGFTATQLEISLTKWLSLLSQAGGSGVTNFNLRVRKNY
ncbi:translocation/assembly module TamB domain-containing protein [Novosphingobium sp. PS1R-30]|uniref:Translocation/assembly module TamB domain-containing protein n=1 Tax=Novosphingobium anseongense TaxID=3133436 RepID=A0ABU8RQ69_9SPHN